MKIKEEYKNKYFIYTRKSDIDVNNQKNSIDYQVNECLRYVQNQQLDLADFTLKGFVENGIIKERHSAFKTSNLIINKDGSASFRIERPKFQNLVGFLAKKDFSGVVCLCWDRLSRNDRDGILIKDLIEQGLDVRFVQTKYEKTSSGALHMDIDSMFAKHHSRTSSEKIRATNAKLRNEGKCVYTSPIGYLDQGSDNKPLDPDRAPIVKRIFKHYATGGWSLAQLAKWANEQGLITKPTRSPRTREEMLSSDENIHQKVSRPIKSQTIEKILKNPFYIGKLKHKGDIIDGNQTSLIDISLFNKVQEILQSRSVTVHYIDKKFFTFRGLIRCSCGRLYSPYKKKGHVYYGARCIRGCTNSDINLSEQKIDAELETLLGNIFFTRDELSEIETQAKTSLDRITKQRNTALDDLHK